MSPEEQLDTMLEQEKMIRATQAEPNDTDLEASITEFSVQLVRRWFKPFFFFKHMNDLDFAVTEVNVLHQHCSQLSVGPPALPADDQHHAAAVSQH